MNRKTARVLSVALAMGAIGCGPRAPRVAPPPVAAEHPAAGSAEELRARAEAARAAGRFDEALETYESERLLHADAFDPAWLCARAAVDLLDFAWDRLARDDRMALAQRAINHAEAATRQGEGRPEGHYYRAVAYGMLGKARGLGGKKAVEPIIQSCERAIALDPAFAGAGAHRVLGALYQKAPAWPVSVGDLEKSRMELEEACRLAPDVPDNHLFLARTLAEMEDYDAARRELATYRELALRLSESERPKLWAEEEAEVVKSLRAEPRGTEAGTGSPR